jgi:aminopeptidase YwaD
MKKITIVWLMVALQVLFLTSGFAQQILPAKLKQHVKVLASDSLEGRKPGLDGGNKAAAYIRNELKKQNISLLGENGFSFFDVVTNVELGGRNNLNFLDTNFRIDKDYRPITASSNGSMSANLYFAGYGLEIKTDSLTWSDYPKTIDYNNSWIVIMRGAPNADKPNSKYAAYASDWAKITTAKDKGAKGIILISPPSIEAKDSLMPLFVDQQAGSAGIPVINVTRNCIEKILIRHDLRIDSIEQQLNKEMEHVGLLIPMNLSATTDLKIARGNTQNVVGVIEGSDSLLKDEYIVIGAHYDHLGKGGPSSGSRMPDTTAVHCGADDNASGVAAILEIAGAIRSIKPKRSVIIVAFGAEELGLVGSKYFFKNKLVDPKKIKAMINLDMIGRMRPDKTLSVGGTGTAAEFDTLLNTLEPKSKMKFARNTDGYGPSDHSSFYLEGIPVLYFSTGAHSDYHTPFDTYDKLDYNSMKLVADLTYQTALSLANRTTPLTYKETGSKPSGFRKLKVTLGIIPDMVGGENKGLRVDGVRKGAPGEKGGLLKGDVIVSINGQPVTNIYDYMARLQTLIPGQTANIEVNRNGKIEVLIIQL